MSSRGAPASIPGRSQSSATVWPHGPPRSAGRSQLLCPPPTLQPLTAQQIDEHVLLLLCLFSAGFLTTCLLGKGPCVPLTSGDFWAPGLAPSHLPLADLVLEAGLSGRRARCTHGCLWNHPAWPLGVSLDSGGRLCLCLSPSHFSPDSSLSGCSNATNPCSPNVASSFPPLGCSLWMPSLPAPLQTPLLC